MKPESIYIGNSTLQSHSKAIRGDIIEISNEYFYKISHYDRMSPFFMNIVSDSDLWMFISSNGALTAGRRNADNALFPYYTDDRIHDSQEITGSKSILLVHQSGKIFLWEPLSNKYENIYNTQRNIYKNIVGNKLIFEEVNHDLKLSFYYAWLNCDHIGFIKKSWIANNDSSAVKLSIIDGIQNILPAGVDRKFQLEYSTLADGYKRNEMVSDSTLALFTLSSIPTDKAEPSESLRATTVWSFGLENVKFLLSNNQLDTFRCGMPIEQETDIKGVRGAYFLQSEFELPAGKRKSWYIVARLNQDHCKVAALQHFLSSDNNLAKILENEVQKSTEKLKLLVARSDGFQLTKDMPNVFRHCSNTLFNIMRGGVFENNYLIEKRDFRLFLQQTYKVVAGKYAELLDSLPDQFEMSALMSRIGKSDPDLEKLCHEYLPLTFSRRHGDPSRPWNQFSIDIKDEQGNKKYNYQGNWRDIFQNWEALALAFPEFIENMIAKFVNASTADGYNPYRVMRDGFEWEELDPDDDWSYIGYWGDHQIIYLLKLLELSQKYHPGKLQSWLTKKIFTYANVPYRIKPYQEIVQDPHSSIDYDYDLDAEIQRRVQRLGTNDKLLLDAAGEIYYVNLTEKILLPLLVKFSNFIPEAGIWMNTQRPEWNDANNAIVGFGASMVTLYYMRRYVTFCIDLFNAAGTQDFEISEEVNKLFSNISDCLSNHQALLDDSISAQNRKRILDQLGLAGSEHRMKIYDKEFSNKWSQISAEKLIAFLRLGLQYIDHSIKANKRDDDLYHAYNLINFTDQNGISIRRMYEMLEGQAAVLSSGYLPHEDAIILLKSLRNSALYRKDQSTYILYPNRELPHFVAKNLIPKELLEESSLLTALLERGDRSIVCKDVSGNVHFNSRFLNNRILKKALDEIQNIDPALIESEKQLILNIYESVFDHQSFTGRSGTFYKYEGLGCIYWHMVSKLLLAVQETFYRALDCRASYSMVEKIKTSYYDIRKGIGIHKSPDLYGAFPTDPYSHTPQNSGGQQPGMTGQAKEDFISRFGEFGMRINDGKISFNAALLNENEFLTKSQVFEYYDVTGTKRSMMVNHGMLAFTICQVPVIYIPGQEQKIMVTRKDGTEMQIDGLEMSESVSASIFRRNGSVENIQVFINLK